MNRIAIIPMRSFPVSHVLLDVMGCLEKNEVEKCQLVSKRFFWALKVIKRYILQRRIIHEMTFCIEPVCLKGYNKIEYFWILKRQDQRIS